MCISLDSLCIAKLSVYAEAVEHGLEGPSRGFSVAPWTTGEKGALRRAGVFALGKKCKASLTIPENGVSC